MFQYRVYEERPPETIVEQIRHLYETIFQTSAERIMEKMNKVENLLVLVAFNQDKVIGFKIGYENDSEEFYRWIGGVAPAYRKKGIGSTLMNMQHEWVKKRGYKIVTTQTKNKWCDMLILNLRHGFDIIGTYTDEKGEPKIILKKVLW
ncbi:MAG TPA: GNAT family N-acetyltransferase [Anoxybacillus sp.]|nr:GNAT family N-acetyltransferase [Anoxybacillus sp.]